MRIVVTILSFLFCHDVSGERGVFQTLEVQASSSFKFVFNSSELPQRLGPIFVTAVAISLQWLQPFPVILLLARIKEIMIPDGRLRRCTIEFSNSRHYVELRHLGSGCEITIALEVGGPIEFHLPTLPTKHNNVCHCVR